MKKTDKQKLFEAFEKVCKVNLIKEERSLNEAYVDDDGNLQDMNYEPKFDNMVNAFCDKFVIHFSDNDEDEATLVHITKSDDDNIKINEIVRGIDKFTPEQYNYYNKIINEMYNSGELILPHTFSYTMKNKNISDIDYL